MILGALLLAFIGSADLVRATLQYHRYRGRAIALVTGIWAGLCVCATAGLGISAGHLVFPLALSAVWLLTTSAAIDARAPAGILPAVGIVLALLAGLVWDRTAVTMSGFIVDWHNTALLPIATLPLPALILGIGIALFMIESANIVVRAALRPAREEVAPPVVPVTKSKERWWRRATAAPVPVATDLRGGRLIGPLERVLIVALTLAGSFPIVAGLFAAKGIVRFPEISNDGASGSKAEYFLVGSLVSWTVALAAAGLLWIVAQS